MFKNFLFKYFYYRIFHLLNYESEDDNYRSLRSIVVISLVQSVYIMNALKFIRDVWFTDFMFKPGQAGYFGLPFIIALGIHNYKKHNNRIEEFDKLWESESGDQRIIKGLLILLFSLLPFLPLLFFDHSPR